MNQPLIYIVDKNPTTRNLIRYNLELKKMTHVHTFPSEEECLFRIRKGFQPDLLITGFSAECYSGTDFLGSVLEVCPDTKVIFFDEFADQQEAARLIELGACDYVVKNRNHDAGIAGLVKNVLFLTKLPSFQPA